jgi:hypothetical protein
MPSGDGRSSTPHGLAFLALLSFVAAFLLARTFTTLYPSTVVVTGGVHFHHFWYGLALVVVSGWLGIAQLDPRLRRLYAVLFGFGGGLIGDEAGLLLTLGNYHSELTYFVVVGIVAVSSLLILLGTRRKELEQDVFSLAGWERIVYAGVAVACSSSLLLAVGFYISGAIILAAGVLVALLGLWLHRR